MYRAWLDANGQVDLVRPFVVEWLPLHQTLADAGFVYRAWLDAGGETAAVRPFIAEWLTLHGLAPEAGFVYRAWLDAEGYVDFVRASFPGWLSRHGRAIDSDFVLRAWLQAGGDFATVAKEALAWVHRHREDQHAVYILKYVARQSDLPDESVRDVLVWCRRHAGHDDALWRLCYLADKVARRGLEGDALSAIDAVTRSLMTRKPHPKRIQLLASIVSNVGRIEPSPDLRERQVTIIRRWLMTPGWVGGSTPLAPRHQVPGLVRLVAAVSASIADADVRARAARSFLAWYCRWNDDVRQATSMDGDCLALLARGQPRA